MVGARRMQRQCRLDAHAACPGPSHTPALAGALVLELLPYNWDWQGIPRLYANLTASLGDVAHAAWRANSSAWVEYATQDDAKYEHWAPHECTSRRALSAARAHECACVHERWGA